MTRSLNVDQAMINKLAGIVLTNLQDENFGVEKLAKEAGMSRVTVHRKIKSFKGQSVSQFIREIRLQKAIKMLEDNEGNVAEIAFKVGFGSPTYFIKCFHDYYGFPPGEARYMKSGEPGDDQAFENSRTGYYKKT
jgi:AraC-like DNA-binding protein